MPRLENLGHRVRQVLRDIHLHLTVQNVEHPGSSSASDSTPTAPSVPVEPDPETASGFSLPEPSAAPTADGDELPWWERETAATPSGAVFALASQIGPAGTLSAVDRIALAYQRGRQAAQIRRGTIYNFWGDRCSLKNRCYLVLRGGIEEEPFFTWSFSVHQRAVRTESDGGFSRRAISHGFPSQTEALAFCLGAGLDGLPRTA